MKFAGKHAATVIMLLAAICFIVWSRIDKKQGMLTQEMSDYRGDVGFEDDVATSVGYYTVGWTVKMYDLPVDAQDNTVFRCKLERKYYVDENGVVHTTFHIDEQELLGKIDAAYPEWAELLRRDGGSVYLDAVMTCTVYKDGRHNLLGDMDDHGNLSGEIYLTYEGIANARWWGDKNVFLPYYDLEVKYQPAEPKEIPEYKEIKHENEYTHYFGCDDEGVLDSGLRFESDVYEVETAIPSGEPLNWQSICIGNAHRLTYTKTQISAFYPVKVNVAQTLQWTDRRGRFHSEKVNYSQWYTVERETEYYRIKDGVVYTLKKLYVCDSIVPTIEHAFDENSEINVRKGYVEYPQYTIQVDVDAGVITSRNNQRPLLERNDYSALAEQAVGKFSCQSDELQINGDVVLNGDGYMHKLLLNIIENKGQTHILKDTANNSYIPGGTIEYMKTYIYFQDESFKTTQKSISHDLYGNTVNVWTPIVISGEIVDNRGQNQMIEPDSSIPELVCGCNFRVGTNLSGVHLKDYKGYGFRNYSCYADKVEVRFNFDVVHNEKLISRGTWIDIGVYGENGEFYLPCDTAEGSGTAEFRVYAYNCKEGDGLDISKVFGNKCNNLQSQHGAYEKLAVEISGQIRKFAVSEAVSRKPLEGENGDNIKWFNAAALPMSASLKRGNEIWFTFETTGAAVSENNILITPRFYGTVNGERTELDLYVKKEAGFCKLSDFGDFGELHLEETSKGQSRFGGNFNIPLETLAVKKDFALQEYVNSKIVFPDDVCFYKNEIVVNFDIVTAKSADSDNLMPLSYSNLSNAAKGYCNRWQREGFNADGWWCYGDIAVYDMKKDYRSAFVVRGTH